jgi:hypothetical protein
LFCQILSFGGRNNQKGQTSWFRLTKLKHRLIGVEIDRPPQATGRYRTSNHWRVSKVRLRGIPSNRSIFLPGDRAHHSGTEKRPAPSQIGRTRRPLSRSKGRRLRRPIRLHRRSEDYPTKAGPQPVGPIPEKIGSAFAMKTPSGPPMTLGNAAAACVRLIVWCKACGHQVEPEPAEMADRYGAETTVPKWRERLAVCSACGSRNVDMVVTGTERRYH